MKRQIAAGEFKASGYNYLEFVEGGFAVRPDRLPRYYSDMARAIEAAHQKGLKVWILLLAGMQLEPEPGTKTRRVQTIDHVEPLGTHRFHNWTKLPAP